MAPQVGLTRLPEFGYELDLSLASAALVPLLRTWIDAAVRDLVLQVGAAAAAGLTLVGQGDVIGGCSAVASHPAAGPGSPWALRSSRCL